MLIVRSMLDLLFSIHSEIINVLKKELYALVIIENFRESFKGGNMRMESNNVVEGGGKRNRIIDSYKGVLIALVVLGHVLEYSVSDWDNNIFQNFIWAVQMPGFMLVAGYFSFRKISTGKKLLEIYKKNMERYFIPFLSWFVLINILLLGEYDRNIFKGLSILFNRVDVGLWFIWTVFVLSLITGLCNFIREKLNTPIKSFFAAGGVYGVAYGLLLGIASLKSTNYIGIKYILYYGLFYGIGWLLRWAQPFLNKKSEKFCEIVAAVCICIFVAVVFNVNLYLIEDNLVGISLRFIAALTGNYVLYYIIKRYSILFEKAKMATIGLYTLEIYVTHMYTNNLFYGVANNKIFTVNGFMTFTISLLCTSLCAVIIILTFKSIPIMNFLFYGKRKK